MLIRHVRGVATQKKETVSRKTILRVMISISGVLFLFGLTWLTFILTFSVPGLQELFQVLFTVFNSLQVAFIFTFILFTEGFSYWKAVCLSKIQESKAHSLVGTSALPKKLMQSHYILSVQFKCCRISICRSSV